MSGRSDFLAVLFMLGAMLLVSRTMQASPATPDSPPAPAPEALPAPSYAPHARKFQAVDADNHKVVLNRPGMISVVIGTNEDSQDAARAAGKAMYPFQGRPDFALVVVVDLRHSIASWVPSIVTTRMRVSLDQEAYELKPYFLKNGNHNNPRASLHVIPDFNGTICPQLNWSDGSDDLRAIIFDVDGREIERLNKVDISGLPALQEDVRKAIKAQIDLEQAKLAAAGKPAPSRTRIPLQHPPLAPYTPFQSKSD